MQHERLASPTKDRWPSKADKALLHKAATTHKDKVKFSNGRIYKLRYAMTKSLAWGEYESVFVSPMEGMQQPCGWFHIKFLLRDD